MRKIATFVATAVVVLAVTMRIAPVHAQTWVSSGGSDSNPCTQTSPCQSFLRAVQVALPGGYISCLTPGDFGAVLIQKAITIDCTGTGASRAVLVTILAAPSPAPRSRWRREAPMS